MKQDQIKPCLRCHKGVAHAGNITFFRVKVEQMVLNVGAIRRQSGLEMMLGSPALAFHMGPQEDLAQPFTSIEGLLCQDCALEGSVIELLEQDKEKL